MLNHKQILVKNVRGLMALSDINSNAKIAKKCKAAGHSVGSRTIGHLMTEGDPQSPTLATIVGIAAAYNVQPWMLLSPDFDPVERATGAMPPPECIALARRLMENPQALTWLKTIFGPAAADNTIPKNGVHSTPTLQQPEPTYKTPGTTKPKR